MTRCRGLALSVALCVLAPARGDDPPRVPKELAAPAGQTAVLTVRAKGVQIYKSVESKAGKLIWVLDSPLADLLDAKDAKIGHHYGGPPFGGPVWEAADGTRLVRDLTEPVKQAAAPKPADVPWLLVRVKADGDKPGTLARVAYVQRVLTEGGAPPADPPKRADTRVGVPYKATYVFSAPAK